MLWIKRTMMNKPVKHQPISPQSLLQWAFFKAGYIFLVFHLPGPPDLVMCLTPSIQA